KEFTSYDNPVDRMAFTSLSEVYGLPADPSSSMAINSSSGGILNCFGLTATIKPRAFGMRWNVMVANWRAVNERSASVWGRLGYAPAAVEKLLAPGATFVAATPPSRGCWLLNSDTPSSVRVPVLENPRLKTLAPVISCANMCDWTRPFGLCSIIPV